MSEFYKNMIAVKVTTTSGHNWSTSINPPFSGAQKYFMNQYFNIGSYPVEKMERVVKVELIK